MRLRDLERLLAPIPPHPKPKAALEQYATPATLAGPLLFEAWNRGDIEGRAVVDLGCGTGIFALGAALLGATPVTGVEVDPESLVVARSQADRLGVDVTWVESTVDAWEGAADTVLMNPPFGSQVKGADRPFLARAFKTADVVYSIHHAPTRDFVERNAHAAGFEVTERWRLVFPLKHQFGFQEKAVHEVETIAYRFVRSKVSGETKQA